MIASLLPGIRELRAPLAAGYLWLVFVYLVVGTPTNTADVPGPLKNVLEVVATLGTAATTVAVSFVAYLVGSVSQDAFGQILPRFLRGFSGALRLRLPIEELVIPSRVSAMVDLLEALSADSTAPAREVTDALRDLLQHLQEMRAAGASEAEKPEAQRPMVEAEEKLRIAILPPLIAVFAALALTDAAEWTVGLLFAGALFTQALARHVEAAQLRRQYYRARDVEEVEQQLRRIIEKLDEDPHSLDARVALGNVQFGRLRRY